MNVFIPTVCVKGVCVNKPHDWIPLIMKEDNVSKIFGIIPEQYILTNMGNTYLDGVSDGILLEYNNTTTISLIRYPMDLNTKEFLTKSTKKYKYYLLDSEYGFDIILLPNKEIAFTTNFKNIGIVETLIDSF